MSVQIQLYNDTEVEKGLSFTGFATVVETTEGLPQYVLLKDGRVFKRYSQSERFYVLDETNTVQAVDLET